jgi:hypothetical protein
MMANPPAPAVPPVRATPRVETRQSKSNSFKHFLFSFPRLILKSY